MKTCAFNSNKLVEYEEELISIVVPVYNVEDYLDKCILSIVNQTYSKIEIILVDDGSIDESARICDEWKKKDERIVVIHKENGGLSSARNVGVKIAKGDYIGFVDSDDYVDLQMYEKLYFTMKKNNADMVICDYYFLDEDGQKLEDEESFIIDEVLNRNQAFQKLDMSKQNYWRYVTAWNKLYKREILEKVRFREGKIHEDEFSIHHFIEKCNKIITIKDKLYFYVKHEGSITTSKFSLKRLDAVEAVLDRYYFFKDKGDKRLQKGTMIGAYGLVMKFMETDSLKDYKTEIGRYTREVLLNLAKVFDLRFVKLLIKYIRYMYY